MSSPKLDALRAMREAQFTGRAKGKPNLDALRAVTQPAEPANHEDDMAKKAKAAKPKRKAPPKAKAKAKVPTKRKAKAAPANVTFGPAETKLLECLRTAPISREEINSRFRWVDHTARAALARLKAKLALIGKESLTKTKTAGTNFYRVA